MLARWAVLLALVGCVESNSVRCPDGKLCPDGTACATVDDETLCVSPDDTTRCDGQPELVECAPGRRCYQGVCLPAGCGNRRVEPDEVCDDGNNGAGDGCSADCQSNEACGNGTIDLVSGEQCDDGPDRALSHDGCAANCTLEVPRWVQFPMPNQIDQFPAWAYDAKRDRMVLFGSFNNVPKTLEWDGRRWFLHDPVISPPPRQRHAMAYDAARERIVLFGGTNFDDTWEWDGATWTLAVTIVSPPARADHTLVYDAGAKRVVLFGGRSTLDANGLDDTWTWNGQVWTQITTTPSPGRRFDHGGAYDPKRGVVVIYGGTHQDVDNNETWELAGSTWTPRSPANTPGARRTHAMTFDPVRGRIILHGGVTGISVFFLDTWSYNGVDWEKLPIPDVTTTSNGSNPIVATFARTGTVVSFENKNDLYRLTDAGWARSDVSIQSPSHRSDSAAAADLAGGRILIHSGIQGAFISPATQVYTGVWSVVTTGPGALTGAAMAYDAKRGQFVLFGGARNDGSASQETWVFASGAWTQLQPTNPQPPGRNGHVMVYDAKRERVVMFGGRSNAGATLGDTWTWDGTSWTELSPPMPPPARTAAAATYDPVREVVILFGGTTAALNGPVFRDTWTWDGATWTRRATSGPGARFASAMAWDAARRRAVMFGGAAPFPLNDQWEWDGTTWTQLSVATIQAPRSGHVMVPSLEGFGVLVNGGLAGTPLTGDLQRLAWEGPAPDETCVEADLDGDGLAGCDDPDCWRVCKPACPPGATFMCTATCGNGTCDAVESCTSCSTDCGACASTCGDLTCSETAATCPGDCP